MEEPRKTGIVDEPRNKRNEEDDLLDSDPYAKALAQFVQTSNTPITIGIQGEWGSGKTSLLYSIWSELENSGGSGDGGQNGENLVVWVNSWEHSLLVSPEESLLSIIQQITEEIGEKDARKASIDKVTRFTKKLGRSAVRLAAGASVGKVGVEVTDDWLEGTNTIKNLRDALGEVIEDIFKRDTNSYKRVIVFVDDLDRIDPVNAVRVLELMKNIFSMRHCVFVLAIDYNVVVKGLKDKFGDRTEENEWEFRAFFDKIIQLPFTMPIEHYDSGSYFQNLLKKIGYLEQEEEAELLSEILENSIGNNPRSIKRLVNSVALIQLINNAENGSDESSVEASKKQVLIGLVALQICAPKIYEMLGREPDFTKWTEEDTAFRVTHRKEENVEEFQAQYNLMTSPEAGDDFNENWEKALFRVCYNTPRLRIQAPKLSRLLSNLQTLCGDNDIGETIERALDQAAVTSISTESVPAEPSGTRLSSSEKAKEWNIYEKMAETKKSKKSKVYAHARGYQYTKLKSFPGAYLDAHGYVIFKNKEDYEEHVNIRHGRPTVIVRGKLKSHPDYKNMVEESA